MGDDRTSKESDAVEFLSDWRSLTIVQFLTFWAAGYVPINLILAFVASQTTIRTPWKRPRSDDKKVMGFIYEECDHVGNGFMLENQLILKSRTSPKYEMWL
jgi:hypothetical protein